MYLSLLSAIICIFLLTGFFKKKYKKTGYALTFFFYLNLIFLITYIFMDYLSGDGINDAILFHIKFGIKGFGINEYILPFTLLVFVNIFLVFSSKNFVRNLFSSPTQLNKKRAFSLCFLTAAFILNPFYKDIYILINEGKSKIKIDDNYFYEQENITNKSKKNIVFLYLEQIERTYLDDDVFPNLTPNLKKLEKESVSFTNIDAPRATNWTIAGMAASQCGIPLLTPIASENSMSGVDQFIPLANCIGDILKNDNYELHYIGGSDLDFAGKGNFYRSHGFDYVQGWYELQDVLNDKNYRSPWGIHDDELLSIVLKRIEKLHKKNINFGIFSLTLDTHHPNGYISKSCKNNKYLDGKNPILNSVHCVDELVGKFVETFKSSSMYEDTILVLLSDHLALKNTATNMLKQNNRKNLFMIFDINAKPQSIDVVGNAFDIGPTVMGFMGLNTDGLALGRNLITNDSLSLSNDLDFVISSNKRKILDLWSFPEIKNGFQVLDDQSKILFGKRYIKYPALIVLDSINEVDQIMFDFYYANPLKNKVSALDKSLNYIWIDKCSKIMDYKKIDEYQDSNDNCLLLQNNKNMTFNILNTNNENISSELIKEYFENE